MIQLNLLARHFKGTTFSNPCTCAIAKAAQDQFGTVDAIEEVDNVTVDGLTYNHLEYDLTIFIDDIRAAESANFDDTITRTIELHETT